MCTVKVGLTFSATEVWSAVMVTLTRSPGCCARTRARLVGDRGADRALVQGQLLELADIAPLTVAIDLTIARWCRRRRCPGR
jgi:hypothetical protein